LLEAKLILKDRPFTKGNYKRIIFIKKTGSYFMKCGLSESKENLEEAIVSLKLPRIIRKRSSDGTLSGDEKTGRRITSNWLN
jgi:hypothetical protein